MVFLLKIPLNPDWIPCYLLCNQISLRFYWFFNYFSLKSCCSVTQSCPTLCDPMDCITPGFPVLFHLPELAQTHVHWVSDVIQPPCPLLSSSPPVLFPSIRVFSNELVLHISWPKYWSFSFSPNEYSGLISFRTDWFDLAINCTLKSLVQHHNSKASILRH